MTSAKDKDITVEITDDPEGPCGFGFSLDAGDGPVQEVSFKNRDHPGRVVYFRIKDKCNSKLVFQPDPKDALWVAPGLGNPPAGSQWPGFIPLSVENEGRKLIVYCRNEREEKWKFTLRFLDPTGKEVEYDPIGDGLNGPRGGF
ncbi:MAG TPA: hypothetical protein VFT40_03565 [Sphingomicrobium sp.]|nr:hypothetical protein [Sphingomicrobium sp.]